MWAILSGIEGNIAAFEGLNACECSYPSFLAEKRGKIAHEWTNKEVNPEVREYLAQQNPQN